jgi:hypothetical protein
MSFTNSTKENYTKKNLNPCAEGTSGIPFVPLVTSYRRSGRAPRAICLLVYEFLY